MKNQEHLIEQGENMFEIIDAIVKLVVCGLNFSKISKEKKKAEIGRNLYLIHSELNQILDTGYDIVDSLENYVYEMDRYLDNHDNKYPLYIKLNVNRSYVKNKLNEQRVNIAEFRDTINGIHPLLLNIIDDEFVRKIVPLIRGKLSALEYLLNILGENKMPVFSFPIEEFTDTIVSNAEYVPKNRIWNLQDVDSLVDHKYQHDFYCKLNESKVISLEEPLWEDVYLEVKKYLSTRNPRLVLEEIKETLKTFKAAIDKNFDKSDIMVVVGMENCKNIVKKNFDK